MKRKKKRDLFLVEKEVCIGAVHGSISHLANLTFQFLGVVEATRGKGIRSEDGEREEEERPLGVQGEHLSFGLRQFLHRHIADVSLEG